MSKIFFFFVRFLLYDDKKNFHFLLFFLGFFPMSHTNLQSVYMLDIVMYQFDNARLNGITRVHLSTTEYECIFVYVGVNTFIYRYVFIYLLPSQHPLRICNLLLCFTRFSSCCVSFFLQISKVTVLHCRRLYLLFGLFELHKYSCLHATTTQFRIEVSFS